MEKVLVLRFDGDKDKGLPRHGDSGQHIFRSYAGREVPIRTEEERGRAP